MSDFMEDFGHPFYIFFRGVNCGCLSLIDSEMAGPIKLKLGRMVEGMGENVLAKEFF